MAIPLRRNPVNVLLTAAILLGMLLLLWPYLPEGTYQIKKATGSLDQSSRSLTADKENAEAATQEISRLNIPSIGVHENVLEGDSLDVLDEEEGAWHQTGSLEGNYVIAGHRFQYLPPNTATFYHLGKIKPGDTITLETAGALYTYAAVEIKTVDQTEVSILNDSDEPMLTLYTCADSRLTRRIVVTAKLVSKL